MIIQTIISEAIIFTNRFNYLLLKLSSSSPSSTTNINASSSQAELIIGEIFFKINPQTRRSHYGPIKSTNRFDFYMKSKK
jgi:hypothetical protein